MKESAVLQLSVVELARRVRAGELSPVALLDAHVARIEQVNAGVNAVVAERFAAARREAEEVERAVATSRDPGPLAGVPFTCKEMIMVDGMPLTFGCRSREDRRAHADAVVVSRLRAAGAIPVAVTNVPEWGMWSETYNHVYGRTNNPWNRRRTPGGSSGGEGAIVGAGGSAFGIGSDIGGSVRMPAAFCGVYGHKPTAGLLPLTGHWPVYADGPDAGLSKRSPYVSIGTLTRSASDIMPLLRVMRGPDGVDPNAEDIVLRDDAVSWAGRRVVVLADPEIDLARRAAGEVRAAVERAAGVMAAAGADVVEAPRRLLQRSADAWFGALQGTGGRSFAESLAEGGTLRLLPELLLSLGGLGRYSRPALFFALGERIGRRNERRLGQALTALERMAAEFGSLVRDDGVLLMPSHPRAAPYHNLPVLRPFDYLYSAGLNALRVPATVVPFGWSGTGMPLSVQFAAARGRDDLTVAAAALLERYGPPWQPAPVQG